MYFSDQVGFFSYPLFLMDRNFAFFWVFLLIDKCFAPVLNIVTIVYIEIEKQVFDTPKNVIISVIYRPPNTDTRLFTENINIVLNIIKRENKICYFMGYYNINILNYDSHSATAQLYCCH